jgi:enoyl-CoA hydratase/carnithine racemase
MSDPALIHTRVENGVAVLTLDNPPLNLVTLELTRRLRAALGRLADDPAARILVVTGAGTRAFRAGSDVSEFPSVADDVVQLGPGAGRTGRLDDFRSPRSRPSTGWRTARTRLAVCCDLLVAGADMRLALPEVKLGVLPGSRGDRARAPAGGEGRARSDVHRGPGRRRTARSWGLVNRVVPSGQALAAALELAHAGRAAPAAPSSDQGGHRPRARRDGGQGCPTDAQLSATFRPTTRGRRPRVHERRRWRHR